MEAAKNKSRNSAGRRILLVLLAAYIAGFLVFVAWLPKAAPQSADADGIVALTGGTERLDAAAALFEKGVGKRLLISGVHSSTSKQTLKQIVHGGRRFDCCADLGFEATNTHGNAIEAARWARVHRFRSLIVVTADYHMPRSLNEFSARMPGVKLIPYPVVSDNLDVRAWWRSPVAFSVLQWEYAKYLGSLALTSLFPPRLQRDRHSTSSV